MAPSDAPQASEPRPTGAGDVGTADAAAAGPVAGTPAASDAGGRRPDPDPVVVLGRVPDGEELILRARGLFKRYPMGDLCVDALQGVDLDLRKGGFLALMGPSGSGKSTLLNLLGSLDQPSEGSVWLAGRELTGVRTGELPDIRRRMIGFIFQGFNLIPSLSAIENVTLPLRYEGVRGREARNRGTALLERMGLAERLHHLPTELSGGEQQRVAIARALVMEPALILADEPTGELDSASSRRIMELLSELHRSGQSLIVVTHDPGTAAYADRIVTLKDGRIVEDRGHQGRQKPPPSETDGRPAKTTGDAAVGPPEDPAGEADGGPAVGPA